MILKLSLGDDKGHQERVLDTGTAGLPVRVVLKWGDEAIVVDVLSQAKTIGTYEPPKIDAAKITHEVSAPGRGIGTYTGQPIKVIEKTAEEQFAEDLIEAFSNER